MVLLSIPISEKRARLSASRPQEVHTTLRVAIRPHGGYIRETDPWMTYPSWAENALGVRETLGAVEGLRVLRSEEARVGERESSDGVPIYGVARAERLPSRENDRQPRSFTSWAKRGNAAAVAMARERNPQVVAQLSPGLRLHPLACTRWPRGPLSVTYQQSKTLATGCLRP